MRTGKTTRLPGSASRECRHTGSSGLLLWAAASLTNALLLVASDTFPGSSFCPLHTPVHLAPPCVAGPAAPRILI